MEVRYASVIAIPQISITIGRFFDHYAHLGGAAFGALYYMYGMQGWDAMRVHALKSEGPTRKV